METVEEIARDRLVRVACAALNIAAFEWSIATGLARCGTTAFDSLATARSRPAATGRRIRMEDNAKALYNSREPIADAGEPGRRCRSKLRSC